MDSYDLKAFGFTGQQAIVYQIGLSLGSSTVSHIARNSNIHRVTTYNILKELVRKGFASTTKKGSTMYYQMLHPKFIHSLLLEKASHFEKLIPDLTGLMSASSKAFSVEVFEGFDGVSRLYLHLLESITPLKARLGVDHIDPSMRNRLYDIYLPKRIEKKIHNQVIVSASDLNTYFADPENVPLTEVRIIQERFFDLSCEIVLFDGDKILMAAMETVSLSGILIRSPLLYQSFERMFVWMWDRIDTL